MVKASDNPFPSVFLDEQASDPATPAADRWRLYAKSGGIYARNAAGTVVGPFAAATVGLGAWTTYTPTWTTTGTAPSLGNGTLTGRYVSLGNGTVLIHIAFTAGSTTTYGTGDWSFSLPVQAASQGTQVISGIITDFGTDAKNCQGRIASGSTTINQINPEGGNWVTNTVPMTWAVSDSVVLSGAYESV